MARCGWVVGDEALADVKGREAIPQAVLNGVSCALLHDPCAEQLTFLSTDGDREDGMGRSISVTDHHATAQKVVNDIAHLLADDVAIEWHFHRLLHLVVRQRLGMMTVPGDVVPLYVQPRRGFS